MITHNLWFRHFKVTPLPNAHAHEEKYGWLARLHSGVAKFTGYVFLCNYTFIHNTIIHNSMMLLVTSTRVMAHMFLPLYI